MDIENYLRQLLNLLGFDNFSMETATDETQLQLHIELPENESGILIGRHGETITALRRIVRTACADALTDRRLTITVNDYRDQREDKIQSLIERGVRKIERTGEPFYLYRLNATERFFAHNLISTDPDLQSYTSHSVDDELGQRVLVIEKKTD
ncbi:KH domain-containing protein [bacterium]|nr:KH domain-containing protein [bacterium]